MPATQAVYACAAMLNERLTTRGGSWKVSHEVEIYDLVERDIYQSPEEPGHSAANGSLFGVRSRSHDVP